MPIHVIAPARALVAQQELEFAELRGLEAGGCLQPVAETGERHGRHGFEDVELAHQRLHDGAAALPGGDGAVQVARAEVALDLVQFVQQQLEPQLVGLVNHDEEHFIVLGRAGARLLQRQQGGNVQVRRIGERHRSSVWAAARAQRTWRGVAAPRGVIEFHDARAADRATITVGAVADRAPSPPRRRRAAPRRARESTPVRRRSSGR